MTWLSWRQFRLQAALTYSGLALLVLLLVLSTRSTDETTVYTVGWASVIALPALIGVFWGAPLVARELEAGTQRLAWTQSVSRTRWLAVKLGLGVAVAMAATALLSLVVSWWCSPIDTAINSGQSFSGILSVSRIEPAMFIGRGIAPIGYSAFAFVLGATAGIVLRRTVPAMALTLAIYVVVQVAMPTLVRSNLSPDVLTTKITKGNLHGLIIDSPKEPVRDIRVTIPKPGAWITESSPVYPDGHLSSTLPAWVSHCAPAPPGQGVAKQAEQACFARLAREGYRQRVTYQPAGRYWGFQAIELGIFLVLAALLAGVSFWRIRRVG
jgi:ABC-type transport system involved in multi-copper enzyme maturation permease subunit